MINSFIKYEYTIQVHTLNLKGRLQGQSYNMSVTRSKPYIWNKFQQAEEIPSQLKRTQHHIYKEVQLKIIEQYRKQMLVFMPTMH
jgi:hypothetical protein